MAALRFLLMAWVFLGGVIGTGLIGPNREAVRQAYGLSQAQFGWGVALIQIVAAGSVLAAAGWLRRANPVKVMMAGLALQVPGFLLISVIPALWGVAAGWAVVTAGIALGSVANRISMDVWPSDPRRGVILLHSFNAGGKIAGPLIAAAFLAVAWRLSFTAVGGVTLVVLAVFIVLWARSHAAYASVAPPSGRMGWHTFRRPTYWLFIVGIGMIAGGEAAFATLLPSWAVHDRGLTEAQGSLLLTVHLVGLAAGRFGAAALTRRLSNRAIIAICLAAGALVFPAVLVENLAVTAVCLAIFGLMFSSTWPAFYAEASGWLRDDRDMLPYGSALGNVLGISLSILASSELAEAAGLARALFFGPAVLWAFGAIYALRLVLARPRGAAEADR